jgi:hypothetical protein
MTCHDRHARAGSPKSGARATVRVAVGSIARHWPIGKSFGLEAACRLMPDG